ncbi:hypothetical protein D9611_012904 [Ephemerocybe angulata]|uniref:Uncharacterized protein n=1 Tax=Ephemerocybe angulata TaxID=980116 RepID=A0A8H5C402_9AGAR|nr:hypothetical protein D9611_012904 [Tulosesus angulatus]
MPQEPLQSSEITRVAKAAVEVVQELGFTCCLFGSAACWYYGMRNRVPNDVDLVVMDDEHFDTEVIKRLIVGRNSNFYLVPARNPHDTFKVLWYRVGPRKKCKVDILLPGPELLSIPYIAAENLHYTRNSGMPLLPFLTLVLLKKPGKPDPQIRSRIFAGQRLWEPFRQTPPIVNFPALPTSTWARGQR